MKWQILNIKYNYNEDQLNNLNVEVAIYFKGFRITDTVGIYTKEKIVEEDLMKIIDECLAKRKCRGYYDSFVEEILVGYEEIRGKEYMKVEMNDEQFRDFYDMHRDKILKGDIIIKFTCSEEKKKCYSLLEGIRRKDDGTYRILTPAGFDPTPFPQYAYPVKNIKYFFIRFR